MKLTGKKIGILIESDFYEHEIWYYHYRFPEEGAELHFLTRLWTEHKSPAEREQLRAARNEVQHYHGHEYHAPFDCRESFMDITAEQLATYAAIIVPSGMVADRLRYTEDVARLPPATAFLECAFANRDIVKGIICHGLWLVAPSPGLVQGRRVVAHNNLIGDVRNMGAIYTDRDVVVDRDLITARTGDHCGVFARTIIDELVRRAR